MYYYGRLNNQFMCTHNWSWSGITTQPILCKRNVCTSYVLHHVLYQLHVEDDLEMAISKLPCACFKTSLRTKPFIWNKFDIQENEPVGETHSHVDTFWPKTFDEISDLMECTACNKTWLFLQKNIFLRCYCTESIKMFHESCLLTFYTITTYSNTHCRVLSEIFHRWPGNATWSPQAIASTGQLGHYLMCYINVRLFSL